MLARTRRAPHICSPPPASGDRFDAGAWDAVRTLTPDARLLFRYSALTFNGHRIHYDMDYSRGVEGYAGLVTHGPLLAQLLMLLAEKRLGRVQSFAFRATAPLMHDEAAQLCWRNDGTLWVRGPDGRQCMTAQAG